MAVLTADRDVEVSGRTEMLHGVLTDGDIYYKGAMVMIHAGLVVVPTDGVAGEGAIGVLKYGTRGVNAAVGQECEIEIGKVWIPFAAAQASDLDLFYHATNDGTIAVRAAQAGDPCGRAIDWKTGFLLIDFRQRLPVTAM